MRIIAAAVVVGFAVPVLAEPPPPIVTLTCSDTECAGVVPNAPVVRLRLRLRKEQTQKALFEVERQVEHLGSGFRCGADEPRTLCFDVPRKVTRGTLYLGSATLAIKLQRRGR